ncbi:MAG: amidohydrolase family protein [Bryobacteraceae bacterium]|nr:amidohydrolase family protein [Bryobacteraceae bacterium]
MRLTGLLVSRRQPVEVRFHTSIQGVDDLISAENSDLFLAPGFIDLQVNGFAGVDYNRPDAAMDQIARSLDAQFACGVTRLLPTVITGPQENITGCLRNLARAKAELENGDAIEGFHVEGPHISPDDGPRGAHPRQFVREPSIEEYQRWQDAARGQVKLITVAPEWPGALPYIEHVTRDLVTISIGHTAATPRQIRDAIAAGATMSTHLGNGSHPELPRKANYIWEQLAADELLASFIADNIHLDRAFLKAALRAKGSERSVLVTDAVMPAGCEPGVYRLGSIEVELKPEGRVVLNGGDRLAGSALHMHDAVSNISDFVSLTEAIAMATINAARAGRIGSRRKGLSNGDAADFVRFQLVNGRIRVVDTWLNGRQVFESRA